ncbi:MAG: hypothetical protein IIX47_07645, partial [Spirochaetaceae bacterium]|nr:hypothetical protein [Spirochaetaceae bacterium]
ALVELDGKPFKEFAKNRDTWKVKTSYTYPGAIQYFGPAEVADQTTKTILLERGKGKSTAVASAKSSAKAEKVPAKKTAAKKDASEKKAKTTKAKK